MSARDLARDEVGERGRARLDPVRSSRRSGEGASQRREGGDAQAKSSASVANSLSFRSAHEAGAYRTRPAPATGTLQSGCFWLDQRQQSRRKAKVAKSVVMSTAKSSTRPAAGHHKDPKYGKSTVRLQVQVPLARLKQNSCRKHYPLHRRRSPLLPCSLRLNSPDATHARDRTISIVLTKYSIVVKLN